MAPEAAEHQLREVGKISSEIFERVIKPRLGMHRPEVLVGPQHGVDAGVVELGGGQVMAVTADPFFILPALGWERAAWFAVQIVASDCVTTGFPPAYLAVDLNLPLDLTDGDLTTLWEAVDATCRSLGMAIVTGHTGRYEGCSFPMVGGATAFAFGPADAYVSPRFARPGDRVVATKGPAIEAAATFGVLLPDLLAREIGSDLARQAADLFGELTIVPAALAAVSAGVRDQGVTSLHDATERGVLGALAELAVAAGTGIVADLDALPLPPAVRAICELTGMDPYAASSEGTLVLTCRPHVTGEVLGRLAAAGVPAFEIGELLPPDRGSSVIRAGHAAPLAETPDPFWPALQRWLDEDASV